MLANGINKSMTNTPKKKKRKKSKGAVEDNQIDSNGNTERNTPLRQSETTIGRRKSGRNKVKLMSSGRTASVTSYDQDSPSVHHGASSVYEQPIVLKSSDIALNKDLELGRT